MDQLKRIFVSILFLISVMTCVLFAGETGKIAGTDN